MKIYLTDPTQLQTAEKECAPFWERALRLVEDERRVRILSTGASLRRGTLLAGGLLLQYGVAEAAETAGASGIPEEGEREFRFLEIPEVVDRLEALGHVRQYSLNFGPWGKPCFAEEGKTMPFFNLSHSGRYLALALSRREVGIDLQETARKADFKALADRFFTPAERSKLGESPDPEAFYRLWVRKEAYGKCTGEGLAGALPMNLTDEGLRLLAGFAITEPLAPEGYRLCVCERT
ncbi:MAG: 4'-phosphopantetheinyl transferase superfamily protein [Lachnospiraceae bacterium]|nr:4'-phosphopantetheinyl transferase superfamily protein [Lachnospiraceae bacterium]